LQKQAHHPTVCPHISMENWKSVLAQPSTYVITVTSPFNHLVKLKVNILNFSKRIS